MANNVLTVLWLTAAIIILVFGESNNLGHSMAFWACLICSQVYNSSNKGE